MPNIERAAAIMLLMAGIACAQTGPSATAINPPTLTPRPVPTQRLTPTPTPAAPDQPAAALSTIPLTVNGSATVHTTEGDKLRVHSRPSYDAPVKFELEDGTPVTIIAGPQMVGTDRWWQIQTADGQSGWAVEAAEGVQTLLPAN